MTEYHYNAQGLQDYTVTDLDGDPATAGDRSTVSLTEFDSYGRTEESIVDRDGDLGTTSDQVATHYVYDGLGRVIRTEYADGTSTSVEYDANGRTAAQTDQLGNTTRYEYDDFGRLTAVVLPAVAQPGTGQMVHPRYEYEYDAAGNRTVLRDGVFQTDPLDPNTIDRTGARETAFTYDLQGRQTGRTLPEDAGQPIETEGTQYDDYGRTSRQVDFLGRVTTYEYDDGQGAGGRLIHVRYYASEADEAAEIVSRTVSYTYDAFGRQVEVDDTEGGATQTSYDDLGRIEWVSSPQGVINYAYDDATGALARTWTSNEPGGAGRHTSLNAAPAADSMGCFPMLLE
jgi:YD repeat-containing protein